MKQRVPVSQIMSKKLVTLNPTQTLYEAEKLFRQHKIRHIPVVENGILVGMLSYSDLLKISYADITDDETQVESVVYDMFSIPQVMAKVPLTVGPETTIKEVAEILAKQTFHSIPITEKNGKLLGIVTTTDLINYLLEQY